MVVEPPVAFVAEDHPVDQVGVAGEFAGPEVMKELVVAGAEFGGIPTSRSTRPATKGAM